MYMATQLTQSDSRQLIEVKPSYKTLKPSSFPWNFTTVFQEETDKMLKGFITPLSGW